jgi:hypothetical protein
VEGVHLRSVPLCRRHQAARNGASHPVPSPGALILIQTAGCKHQQPQARAAARRATEYCVPPTA